MSISFPVVAWSLLTVLVAIAAVSLIWAFHDDEG